MTAWVLILHACFVSPNCNPRAIVVSGIASEEACYRLACYMTEDRKAAQCIPYAMAIAGR